MRSFISNYIQAEKARREESGEAGFSLIELIVVVVILGILAAVAIPVFMGLQAKAEEESLKAIAANAATAGASQVARNLDATAFEAAITAEEGNLSRDGVTVTISGTTIETICGLAARVGGQSFASGPGASADGTSCSTATP
ncbi:type II secretion system protein [Microbacterium sp. CPCC 204701]|uniref:type II secretion system protein n=1 Tax=Microbacterium sp. CPCC 204701 TaxID=2493084 RepID=UPI000FD7A53D|nr:prepilin-type N-terminal cleavage/methylation domain-containing protein [Microbacterium sp. CPCC 204701]